MNQHERAAAAKKNFARYALREAFYNTALLFINGTLIQLLLAQKGVSSAGIGGFNTTLHMVNMATTMLFSGLAEQKTNLLRAIQKLLLPMGLIFAIYLPMLCVSDVSQNLFLLTAVIAAGTQMIFCACKGILDYKLLYQIIDLHQYGALTAISGISMGIAGAAFSWGISMLVEVCPGNTPFVLGLLLSMGLILGAAVCNHRLVVINEDPFHTKPVKIHPAQIVRLFRIPEFSRFILPNALRGVTYGIFGSIVLIALRMGVSTANTARIAAVTSIGHLAGSALFYLLDRRYSARCLACGGSLLVAAVLLLPKVGNSWGFLLVYLVSYVGRVVVDYSVPVMVLHIIDPAIAGIYNAWRNTLLFLTAAVVTFLVGLLIDTINPAVFLSLAGGGYLLSSLCYYHLYPKFAGTE